MNDLFWSILLLVAVLLLQQFEEGRTGLHLRFPPGKMSVPLLVGLNLVLCTVGGLSLLLAFEHEALVFPLAWIFAGLLFVNAVGRLGIMLVQKAYFPGGLSAFPLIALTGNLVFNLVR